MSIRNRVKQTALKLFSGKQPTGLRGFGGAVARKDDSSLFGSYFNSVISRAGVPKTYSDFTDEVFRQLSDKQKRSLVARGAPIVAKAVADHSDNVASGYSWTSDTTLGQYPETPAQQLLEDFLLQIENEQGGIERLIAEMARGMFIHGACFTELIVAEDLVTPIRLKILDPTTARYRKNYDEAIGEYYELGQDLGFAGDRTIISGAAPGSVNFVSLHGDPTIQYRPIQSGPNNPYGTPIIDPAVFHVQMMANFFSAFQEALTGHVWPNMLISMDLVKFRENAGTADPEELEKKLNAALETVEKNINELKPGGAVILGDDVSIGGQLSGQNRSPLGSIKDIQDVLRREIIVGVQSQPILMGSNEAIAETHAIEQLKAYGKTIRRSQKVINGLMTDYFNLILEINGYPRLAEFKLSYINSADYKDQATTYKLFREGLLAGSDDIIKLVEALEAAKLAGYMDELQAQEAWEHEMEIRRQINIIPQDL